MNFKKNIHLAVNFDKKKTERLIRDYPKQYKTPKYLLFIKTVLDNGYKVKVYEARVSKYVFVKKEDTILKIRFSNHKPLFEKEEESDCDYYVGVSHKQVITTENLIEKLLSKPL